MLSSDGWGFWENVVICRERENKHLVLMVALEVMEGRTWPRPGTMTTQTDLSDDIVLPSKLRLQCWEWWEFDVPTLLLRAQHCMIEVSSFVAKEIQLFCSQLHWCISNWVIRHFGDLQQVGYSPALVDCACWMFVNERLCDLSTQQLCDNSKDPEHIFKKRLQHRDKKTTSQPQRNKTAGSPLLSFCCLELTFEFGLVSRSHLLLERRRMAELRLMMWLMVSLFASANSGGNLWVPLSRYSMNWSCKNKTHSTRAFKTGIVVSTLKQHYVGFLPKKR